MIDIASPVLRGLSCVLSESSRVESSRVELSLDQLILNVLSHRTPVLRRFSIESAPRGQTINPSDR